MVIKNSKLINFYSKHMTMVRFFTLVELLIVISVIAILASLLLPALKNAKEKAKGVVCLSQLKQMGFANQMYADVSDDYCVPPGNWSWKRCVFYNSLFLQLLGNKKAYHHGTNWSHIYWKRDMLCPSVNLIKHPTEDDYYLAPASWGINVNSMHPKYYATYRDAAKLPGKLASRIFFLDHVSLEAYRSTADPSRYRIYQEYGGHSNDASDGQKRVAYRHNKLANVLFFDGHASAQRAVDLFVTGDAVDKVWRLR